MANQYDKYGLTQKERMWLESFKHMTDEQKRSAATVMGRVNCQFVNKYGCIISDKDKKQEGQYE